MVLQCMTISNNEYNSVSMLKKIVGDMFSVLNLDFFHLVYPPFCLQHPGPNHSVPSS
jgi:hypothetical protein